jgi:hypothetical protein
VIAVASRVALAVALVLATTAAVGAHDPVVLDPLQAAPGIGLQLVEVPQPGAPASAALRFRLLATGVPRGLTYGVWTRDFTHGFHEVLSGFRADDTGKLLSVGDGTGRPRDLSEIVLDPGPYFRGAIWEVALVSEDRTITAFTRAIPRPMVARDGGCVVTLELVSHRGQRFLAAGNGFGPGENVVVESRWAGRVQQKRVRTSAEGRLPPDVLTHVAAGTDHGARYSVKGRSCEVTIDYEWGEAAFQRG